MKENESPEEKWKRLTGLAREAEEVSKTEIDDTLPPGFVTSIAATWASGSNNGKRTRLDVLERALRWSSALSAAACVAILILSKQPTVTEIAEEAPFDGFLFAPQRPENEMQSPFF